MIKSPRRFRVRIASATIPLSLAALCGASFEERVVDASPPGDPWMMAIGDLNGDGKADLVVCRRNGPLVWYENPSWTRRTLSAETGVPGSSTGIAIGDVDGNGSLDVVLANGVWFANPGPAGDPRSTRGRATRSAALGRPTPTARPTPIPTSS